MTQVQIERSLSERLASGRGQVELRDDQGQLVGFFVPAGPKDSEIWERARSAFSDEEIDQARRSPSGGQPLSKILEELEQKWPSR